jgi:hypothetical protein
MFIAFILPIMFYFKSQGYILEKKETIICCFTLAYGFIGGSFSTYFSIKALAGS